MKHIEVISNGMGSQSLMLHILAAEGKIPAKLSIVGDTGSENDCLWSTGERSTAKEYWQRIMKPFCAENGIEAVLIQAQAKNGEPLSPIIDLLKQGKTAGVPFYGSHGGKNPKSCTQKYKIRAVRQELRRRGATTARVAIGYTVNEAGRIKSSDVRWCQNWWPLAFEFPMYRSEIRDELRKRDLPFLISTECDMCPAQDLARWKRHRPEIVREVAEIERGFDGLFFSDIRIPLLEAIEKMQSRQPLNFCDDGFGCGI